MRRIYLFTFFFVCCVATALAQEPQYEYVPLVREGVKWYWSKERFTPIERKVSYFSGDTILEGIAFKKYYYYSVDNEPENKTPFAFLREENKVVYIVYNFFKSGRRYTNGELPFSNEELGEQILYDFNDVNIPYGYDGLYTLSQMVNVAGSMRKCWYGDVEQIIEGLGFVSFCGTLTNPFSGVISDTYTDINGVLGLSHVTENGDIVYVGPNYEYFINALLGDLNRDGVINVADASTLWLYYIQFPSESIVLPTYDLNEDREISKSDIEWLYNRMYN